MPGVPLTSAQRVFLVRKYFETKSLAEVGRLFSERFPERAPVKKVTIWYNVKRYTIHGTSLNRHEKNSGRKRTGRSP